MIKLFNVREVTARCVLLACLLALCACGQAASPQVANAPKAYAQPVSLALVGYNCTSRHIHSFTVDGQGEFYKEREVTVDADIPADAKNMEVHFYPDRSVKAPVTGGTSPPRLLLRKERENNSKYPRCPNDKKPE